MRAVVEICVEGVPSAIAAQQGGADRVELCADLAVGGVTPGGRTIAEACHGLGIPVHVLIRPRGGDFVYRAAEIEVIRHDIRLAGSLGARGVVFGLLTRDGRVDRGETGRLSEEARPLSVTFHKAFDAARDPFEALEDLIALGVDRVLTSGHPVRASEGLGLLAELVGRADGRIAIMAGGSIGEGDVRPLLGAGIREIHVGSAACWDGVTDPELVRRVVAAASMGEILPITTRAEWDRAVAEGVYRAGSLATEGFLHASDPGQLAGSANRFFRGRTGLVALRIDPDRVRARIRRDWSPDSDWPFPHILGPLNLDAVVAVIPLEPDEQGAFRWPPRSGARRFFSTLGTIGPTIALDT